MRFRIIAIFVSAITTYAAIAETAGELYAFHEGEIRTNRVCVVGEYVFFAAKMKGNFGSTIGIAKANAFAMGMVSDFIRDNAKWPNGVTDCEKASAWETLLRSGQGGVKVKGIETIKTEETSSDGYLVVLAVPKKNLDVATPEACVVKRALAIARENTSMRDRPNDASAEEGAQLVDNEPFGISTNHGVIVNETLSQLNF